MRPAIIAGCVSALLLIADFSRAESLLRESGIDSEPVAGLGLEYPSYLLVSALEEMPPADAESQRMEPQEFEDPLFSEPPSCAENCGQTCAECGRPRCGCRRCRYFRCQCPETPHPCNECSRVNNVNPAWGLTIGGTISADALYNSARPVAPGTPFFLTPKGPFKDDTFDIHARETTVYLIGDGPKIGNYESGALIMFALYNDSITVDRYGFLPFQAFGELKNEDWRFAGGLQIDIFAPVLPTVLPFSFLAASGNAGIYRGQIRAERFYHYGKNEQVTVTAGISDPNPTLLNNDVLSEDNGWPNIELRAAWAAGPLKQVGLAAQRPFELGISSVVGQIRSTDLGPLTRVVADVWGVAVDYRWRVNESWGLAGEFFTGQGLGTYGGEILQIVNSTTFEAIRGTGGWAEVYFYCTPCVHTHWGYGVDDPDNDDLAATQIARNETVFANVIWDVTQSFRLAQEFTYRTTDYLTFPDNEGFGLHGQMQWKF